MRGAFFPFSFQALIESVAGAGLPEWQSVAQALQQRRVAAGEMVFAQAVAHPYVYVVRSGLLKLCYLMEDGTEWVKSFADEGHFFASIAALQPQGRTTFMACAIEATELESIDFRLLADLGNKHQAWAAALHKLTLEFAARKEARERELLTLDAQGRYLSFCAEYPRLHARVPQKDLARHLGVTPVGLNRIVMRERRRSGS